MKDMSMLNEKAGGYTLESIVSEAGVDALRVQNLELLHNIGSIVEPVAATAFTGLDFLSGAAGRLHEQVPLSKLSKLLIITIETLAVAVACSRIASTKEVPISSPTKPNTGEVVSATETAIPSEREKAPQATVVDMDKARLAEVKGKIENLGFLLGYANDTLGSVNLAENKLEVIGGSNILDTSNNKVGEFVLLAGPNGLDMATSVKGDWESGAITRLLPEVPTGTGSTVRSWGYVQALDKEGTYPVSVGPETRGLAVWMEEWRDGTFVGNWYLNPNDKSGTVYAVSLPGGKQVASIQELAGLNYLKGLEIIANSDDPSAKGWEWVDMGSGEERVIQVMENGVLAQYRWNETTLSYESVMTEIVKPVEGEQREALSKYFFGEAMLPLIIESSYGKEFGITSAQDLDRIKIQGDDGRWYLPESSKNTALPGFAKANAGRYLELVPEKMIMDKKLLLEVSPAYMNAEQYALANLPATLFYPNLLENAKSENDPILAARAGFVVLDHSDYKEISYVIANTKDAEVSITGRPYSKDNDKVVVVDQGPKIVEMSHDIFEMVWCMTHPTEWTILVENSGDILKDGTYGGWLETQLRGDKTFVRTWSASLYMQQRDKLAIEATTPEGRIAMPNVPVAFVDQ